MNDLFRTIFSLVGLTVVLVLGSVVLLVTHGGSLVDRWDHLLLWDGLAVFALGAGVGAGEIASRYKTDPARAVLSLPGRVYLTVNGLAGILALVILTAAGINLGVVVTPADKPPAPGGGVSGGTARATAKGGASPTVPTRKAPADPPAPPPEPAGDKAPTEKADAKASEGTAAAGEFWDAPTRIRFYRILAAGFGAVALFRSSFFTVRSGDRDVPIGFYIVLKSILDAVDRAVDRLEGVHRHEVVADRLIAQPLTFTAVWVALPAYCFGLMQNLTGDELEAATAQIAKIAERTNLTDRDRLRLLYLQLLTVVGESLLVLAVTHFATQPPAPPPPPAPRGS